MRLFDVIGMRAARNKDPLFVKKGRRMLGRMARVRSDNPEQGDMPTGWRVDPHQGSHNGINWR